MVDSDDGYIDNNSELFKQIYLFNSPFSFSFVCV